MRLQSLIHLVGIAAAIAPDRRIVVVDAASLLGSFPELGDHGGPLETSPNAVLLIEDVDEGLVAVMKEAIGEASLFAARERYHVDTLYPALAKTVPQGWEKRLVPLPGREALCLDPHDLAAAKVQAGRPKDVELCATLVARGRVDLALLQERLRDTEMSDRLRTLTAERLEWVSEMAGQQSA